MVNTSPATCQCLATFTPLKSKILIFFHDVISLLARVFIFLIDKATQEIPMKNIWKKFSVQFSRYAIELLGSMSTDEAWRHLHTLHFYPEYIDLPGVAKVGNNSLNITIVIMVMGSQIS